VASFLVPVFWRFSPGGRQAHMTTPTHVSTGQLLSPEQLQRRVDQAHGVVRDG
jgi:hypothetical protein